jgi:putative ABC transport system ATP-binding protein
MTSNNSKLVEIHHISKTYDMGEVKINALRDVSFDIHVGDFLIIRGRNGSGKSTLLRQIGLLDRPNTGTILLEGKEVIHMKEEERRKCRLKKIGYIFQEYALIAELTAIENVMLPAMILGRMSECRERAMKFIHEFGLEKRMHNLPRQLSGGEQQKVAIARALMNDPIIIFADEPTANLDTVAARDVLKIFKRLNDERHHTIVMITHEPDEEKYANRIVTLSDGRMV